MKRPAILIVLSLFLSACSGTGHHQHYVISHEVTEGAPAVEEIR